MRYKLRLTRSSNDFATVDIPADFFIKTGDTIQYNDKFHELKHIIRPAIDSSDLVNNTPSPEQFKDAMAILVVGDGFTTL